MSELFDQKLSVIESYRVRRKVDQEYPFLTALVSILEHLQGRVELVEHDRDRINDLYQDAASHESRINSAELDRAEIRNAIDECRNGIDECRLRLDILEEGRE
jgi:hypothetical protein